jgi:hypothetical protein
MANLLDLLMRPGGGTVDQVMRDAKGPRLPGPSLHTLPLAEMLPAENIGEVGDRPPVPPQKEFMRPLSGAFDETAFADAMPRLPPPTFANRPPAPQESGPPLEGEVIPPGAPPAQPASGGGLPVQSPGGQPPASAMPRATATDPLAAMRTPEAVAAREQRQQEARIMLGMAGMMAGSKSPAQRVQAVQLMFEARKLQNQDVEEAAKLRTTYDQRQLLEADIEAAPASDEQKAQARALLRFDPKASDVREALGITDAASKQRQERREQFTKWGAAVSQTERDLGTLEVNANRALKILDEGTLTTGLGGWASSFVPGSAHNKLVAALDPLRALTGYGYLQEMREASKTGGAVGNVTENETRWLMGIQGSLDPVNNDPDTLKENIKTIVRGKAIVAEMRKLAPALDAGDPAAWDKYAKLTRELGQNGATIKERIKADTRDVPSTESDYERTTGFEQKYGVR